MSVVPTCGIIRSTPSAWDPSSKYLAAPFGRLLHIYDVTCLPPKRLATSSAHQAPITGVLGLPGMQFVSSSMDATLRFWDAMDGQCVRTIDLARPILAVRKGPNSLICLTDAGVVRQPLDSTSNRTVVLNERFRLSSIFATSNSCNVIAVAAGVSLRLAFLSVESGVGSFSGRSKTICKSIVFDFILTAVAVSSNGLLLAAADEHGKIYLFNDLSRIRRNESSLPRLTSFSPTIWHWHASPLYSLTFAHEDSVIVSVGQEAVLVNWSLSFLSYGEKTFMARLGAPCIALSASFDGIYYAISQLDNSISLVDQSTSSIVTNIRSIANNLYVRNQHLYVDGLEEHDIALCKGIGEGRVLIANDNTRIQEFNAIRGEHVRNIDIVPRNAIYSVSKGGINSKTDCRVTHVALHPLGKNLVTVDVVLRKISTKKISRSRSEKVCTLRFWSLNESNKWTLSSVITNPHGDGNGVITLVFHPLLKVLLTIGSDKTFKFWRAVCRERQRVGLASDAWRCELTGAYREQKCTCAAFSFDGTLLAIGCGNVLTLWEVTDRADSATDDGLIGLKSECTLELDFCQSLVYVPLNDIIQSVKFVMCGVALFVATTPNGIYVWNALTHGLWWSIGVRCEPRTLTVDPHTGRLAVVVRVNSVFSERKKKNDSEDDEGADSGGIGKGGKRKTPSNSEIEGVSHLDEEKMSDSDEGNDCANGIIDDDHEDMQDDCHHSEMGDDLDDILLGENDVKELQGSAMKHFRSFKKKRRKSKFQRSTKKWRVKRAMDCAVAVFDSISPLPVRVIRLSPGVNVINLSFVDSKQQNNSLDHINQSTLICIDSKLEVSAVLTEDSTDNLSIVTDEFPSTENMDGEKNRIGNLDQLLGNRWEEDKPEVTDIVEMSVQSGAQDVALERAFECHFSGPIHTQAPIITHSFDFVKDLLKAQSVSGNLTDHTEKESPVAPYAVLNDDVEGEEAYTLHSNPVQSENKDEPSSALHSLANIAEMREICEEIIQAF